MREQVSLITVCWGGRGLRFGFRPPSSGLGDFDDEWLKKQAERRKFEGDPKELIGFSYRELVRLVHETLRDLKAHFPQFDGGSHYRGRADVFFNIGKAFGEAMAELPLRRQPRWVRSSFMPSTDKPNILMIQADQMTAMALGCYGHPAVQTPNLDQLAAEGVLFENCYCSSPLCGPSRASMVTGRQPWKIGAYDNANELPASVPTFMHLLRREGYELWLSGKMHFVGPDQLHGFHGRMNTDIYPSTFEWTPDWRKGAYGNPGTSVHYLHQSGPCAWGLQLDYDEETQALGLRCLRDLTRRRAKDGRPFFLCVSFTHPHDPFNISQEYWDLYEEVEIPPPSAPARPLHEMHPFNQWLQTHHEVDAYPPSEETTAATRRAYLAMVSYVDAKVGQLLDELFRLGIDDDTIVLFTSDHGDMQGEHGMWFKRTFHEWSMRVPLLFWQPTRFRGERRIPSPVSLLDLFPTLTDLGSAPDDWPGVEDLDGRSLAGFLRGEGDEWDYPVLCEYLGEGVRQPMRMVRYQQWKYVAVHQHEPLLFDLSEDPHELTNLAGTPEVATEEASLRDLALEGWDGNALRETVMADQQQRLLLLESLDQGAQHPWDYQPTLDASQQWVRRGFSTQEKKRQQRWPHVPDDA